MILMIFLIYLIYSIVLRRLESNNEQFLPVLEVEG